MNWGICLLTEHLAEFSKESTLLEKVPAVQVSVDAFSCASLALESVAYSGVPVVAVASLFPDSVCRSVDRMDRFLYNSFLDYAEEKAPMFKAFGCQYVLVEPNTFIDKTVERDAPSDSDFWLHLADQFSESDIKLCLNYSYPLPPDMCYKSYNVSEISALCGQLNVYMNNLEKKQTIHQILKECNFNISIIRINYLHGEGESFTTEFLDDLRQALSSYDQELLVLFCPLYKSYDVLREEWLRICSLFDNLS